MELKTNLTARSRVALLPGTNTQITKEYKMKQAVTLSDFLNAFRNIRPDNFSDMGLKALFNYLEAYEDSIGDELELDVIAFCCDFTEYESLKEFQSNYSDEYKTIEDIENSTGVIQIEGGGFIIQQF